MAGVECLETVEAPVGWTRWVIPGYEYIYVKCEDGNTFSKYICDYYDNSKNYHDGKWMYIDVTDLEQLEEVKRLIQIKKKPNRKPFPKENAALSCSC